MHQPVLEVTELPKFNMVKVTKAPSVEGWNWEHKHTGYSPTYAGVNVDRYGFSESAELNPQKRGNSRRKWKQYDDATIVRSRDYNGKQFGSGISCLIDDCPDCGGSGYDAARLKMCDHPEVSICLCPSCAPNLFKRRIEEGMEDQYPEVLPWEGD